MNKDFQNHELKPVIEADFTKLLESAKKLDSSFVAEKLTFLLLKAAEEPMTVEQVKDLLHNFSSFFEMHEHLPPAPQG